MKTEPASLKLGPGSRVGVIGGGPAGAFFSYFLLNMAQRAGLPIQVDIYEMRDFDKPGPAGCNSCGGVVSEWLVQALAAEGLTLPPEVVERGIDSYVMRTDVGDVRIDTPLREKRIATVHRGAGPRGLKEIRFRGLDSFLLQQARDQGARVVRGRVTEVELCEGRPRIKVAGGDFTPCDLLAVAMGKNTPALKMFEALNFGYRAPKTTRTYIAELPLGAAAVAEYLGSSMQVFLLNLPRLEFGALIPKGDYATLALVGEAIDPALVQAFVNSPEVRQCLPPDWTLPADLCHCLPGANIRAAVHPYTDRVVFIGDCGVTRLYKDGIGAAYRTAKAAAVTVIFEGVAKRDFDRHYAPLLRRIVFDNLFGRAIFRVTRVIQRGSVLRRGLLRMVADEQRQPQGPRRLSTVLWDTFTGSAPYREVLFRTLHPAFWLRFGWNVAASLFGFTLRREPARGAAADVLGKVYPSGATVVRQGEPGDCMFVIQAGQVEVVQAKDGREARVAVRGAGEFFGEMALLEREMRMATVRTLGEARILTIDRRTFERRVREDPSLAYRVLQKMSGRLRQLSLGNPGPVAGGAPGPGGNPMPAGPTGEGERGREARTYRKGELLLRERERGDWMYLIRSGQVEVVQAAAGGERQLGVRGPGDFVGEMAIFESETRLATVRALSETRVWVLDKHTFLRQIHEDPSLAYRMMQKMSGRIRELSQAAGAQPFSEEP